MITISLSLFTGCGSKDTSKSGDNDTAVDVKPEPTINKGEAIDKDKKDDKATNTEKVQAGTELSTFMSNYIDAKTKVWDEMSKDMEKNDNTAFSMSTLGFVFMDLIIVEIGLFDALNTKEGDTFKGALMLSGIDAWKKVKSDVIEFGYDYVHKDDKNQNKKGDREVTTGKFDKTNNSVIEHIIDITFT